MRQGLRARAPARADRATQYVAPNQMWGETQWHSDPWLPFGADPKLQNSVGELHCEGAGNRQKFSQVIPWVAGVCAFTGSLSNTRLTVSAVISAGPGLSVGQMVTWDASSGTAVYITALETGSGGVGTYTTNASVGTITSRSMWSRHPWANKDGGMGFGIVDDPVNPGRYAHILRVTEADGNQAGSTGRKNMPRTEGSGTGELQYSDMMMQSWSVLVPTATRQMYTGTYFTHVGGVATRVGWGMSGTLIWQNKTGQPIQHALWLCAPGNQSPNQAGPYFEIQPSEIPTPRFQKILINFPADTWIHFIALQKHGVKPWVSGLRMYDARNYAGQYWAQIANAGYCYVVISGAGVSGAGTASNTAPTHTTTGAEVVHDGMTWRCLGPISAALTDPHFYLWAAIGNAAYQLVINDNTETQLPWPDGGFGNSNEINTQWGWYTLRKPETFDVYGVGAAGLVDQATITSYPNSGWTASSDGVNVVSRTEKAMLWKGPIAARPVIANQYRSTLPSDRLLTEWFAAMRSR